MDISTGLGSGRIERPDIGFAVITPPGWSAWQSSTELQDWWGEETWVHLWLEPTPDTDGWWMGTCAIGEDCTYERMVEAGGEAYCWVVEDTERAAEADWSGPATPAVALADGLADQGGWSQVGTTLEELPSGEAGVVRAIDPNGWPQEIWHLSVGERWNRISCSVLESEDRPREIAETFESLPVAALP